jgi:hypothetical protein
MRWATTQQSGQNYHFRANNQNDVQNYYAIIKMNWGRAVENHHLSPVTGKCLAGEGSNQQRGLANGCVSPSLSHV